MSDFPPSIGRYRIEAVLGRGAMGVVYKGHDPEIDRPVAIKLIRADLLSSDERDEYLARFRQEARAAGRCMHTNIVAIYDIAVHDGNPFLTMEYVEGRSLSQAFDRSLRFTPPEAIGIILQVLEALEYAHARGIVHRDIKPANIMLLDSGVIKVGDFGISRLPGSELTMAGSVIGTPSYMSPEQCRGEEVDPRTDLFSTGTVLFQLLTGEKPFPGKSVTEIVYRLMNEEPPDLASLGVAAPAGIDAALKRALAKRPDDRFPAAHDMADALRPGLGGRGGDERTLVVRDLPRPEGIDYQHPEAPAGFATGERTGTTRFDPTVLSRIERSLAQFVGPMARVLVRNAAVKADTTADLCAGLAQHITTPKERAEFLTQIRVLSALRQEIGRADATTGSLSGTVGSAAPPTPPVQPLSAEDLARVQHDLAIVLGPIARFLVQRNAGGAASERDLREKLAEHIKGEADRVQFLAGRASK